MPDTTTFSGCCLHERLQFQMSKKAYIVLLFILLSSTAVFSQSIQRYGVSSGAGLNGGSAFLQSNIGDWIVATYANSVNIISQGYVQNEQLSITTHLNSNSENLVNVYPNPFVNTVNLELISSKEDIQIEVVDVLGKRCIVPVLNNFTNGKSIHQLDFENAASGVYFVRVYFAKNNFVQVFKISKV